MAFAATDVTVTIDIRDVDIGRRGMDKNIILCSITFGDSSETYATGGIPLPAIAQFGLHTRMDRMHIQSDPDDGFVYKFDRTNHKLKIFTQGVVTGSTGVSSGSTSSLIENSASAEGTAELVGGSPDTTYDLGPMIELPNGTAPDETTLELTIIGE